MIHPLGQRLKTIVAWYKYRIWACIVAVISGGIDAFAMEYGDKMRFLAQCMRKKKMRVFRK